MRRVLLVVVVVFALASLASAANILDLIYRGATADSNLAKQHQRVTVAAPQQKQDDAHPDESQETSDEKSCDCNELECMCCVDFNMTFIDLGKGCVRMKYISQTEGVLLNVSYGDNLLRSGMSRGPRPAATCVSMIGQLAAVCARFTTLVPQDDGLKGCLKLEPKLLGDVQTRLSIGCFSMDANGMRLDDSIQELEQEQEATTVAPTDAATTAAATGNTNQTSSADENGTGNLNEDEILAAVNESAQKGLAFFQNWLGLDFGAAASTGNETQQDEANAENTNGTEASNAKQALDLSIEVSTETHDEKVKETSLA